MFDWNHRNHRIAEEGTKNNDPLTTVFIICIVNVHRNIIYVPSNALEGDTEKCGKILLFKINYFINVSQPIAIAFWDKQLGNELGKSAPLSSNRNKNNKKKNGKSTRTIAFEYYRKQWILQWFVAWLHNRWHEITITSLKQSHWPSSIHNSACK